MAKSNGSYKPGIRHARWKGGLSKDAKGYIKINKCCVPDEFKVMAGKSSWILYHRYVMACILDRPLKTNELVHHKSGDIWWNVPFNLELTTRGKHALIHDFIERMKCPIRIGARKYSNNLAFHVCSLIAEGLTESEVGKRLNLSRSTVNYLKRRGELLVKLEDL